MSATDQRNRLQKQDKRQQVRIMINKSSRHSHQNSNCLEWYLEHKYHSILHANAPFSCMKRMKSMMSLQVWVCKSHHWKSLSEQLKLCTHWLYSGLMSPNFLFFPVPFKYKCPITAQGWMTEHAQGLRNHGLLSKRRNWQQGGSR